MTVTTAGVDAEAFWVAIESHDRAFRRLAYRLTGDAQAMDDVLQSAYIKAFRALPRFEGRSSLKTWLHRIVFNESMDHLRREGRRAHTSLSEVAEPRDARTDPAATAGIRVDLAEALAALPAEQRAAVLLVDAEELSYVEAAEILGVPRGTLASQLNRARNALRTALTVEGEER